MDVVWALHAFEAENPDELPFEAGERIEVLERDDQYGDGWYQGRNPRGEVGLFPQSYTSNERPEVGTVGGGIAEESEEDAPNPNNNDSTTTTNETPITSLPPAHHSREKLTSQDSADRLNPNSMIGARSGNRVPSLASSSRRNSTISVGDDEDDSASILRESQGSGPNHRAALAQKAMENAEEAAREEQERAERRKKEDEEAYERVRNAGLIEGLQLSDESDDEDEVLTGTGAFPLGANGRLSRQVSKEQEPQRLSPHKSISRTSSNASTNNKRRDRADTQPSVYAESTYSQSSSVPPLPETTVPPLPGPAVAAFDALLDSSSTPRDLTPVRSREEDLILAPPSPGVNPAQLALPASPLPSDSLSQPRDEPSSALAGTATFSTPKHVPTPLPLSNHSVTNGTAAASPTTSQASGLDQSRASSRLGTALTGETSPGPSSLRGGTINDKESLRDLPADPLSWNVDDVVEWARQKGFDNLTLNKFAEHEISGDVLLEMDVAMLKEIDLVAFGRRVHIYNAIKELKSRRSLRTSTTSTGSLLSPQSGYVPDSPGTVGSPTTYQSPESRWENNSQPNEKLAGLGLDSESAGGSSIRAPSSLGQRSVSNLRSARSVPAEMATTTIVPSAERKRSITTDTQLDGLNEARPIAEESADGGETTDASRPRSTASGGGSKTPSLLTKPKMKRSSTSRSDVGSATTVPSSPNPANSASRMKPSKSDRGSTFLGSVGAVGGLMGRNRKPPPRVPSALLLDSDGKSGSMPRSRSTLQDRAKRSTRLFGAFSPNSGSERSAGIESIKSKPSMSTLSSGRDAPTSMSVKVVDPAGKEMIQEKVEAIRDGNLMDKLGRPDNSGWMRKKGEKYNTWKQRFFVLKGTYLYYLKSEQEQRAKGVINLTGYRVISDPDIHAGEYGFKIVHDTERTHYFSAAEQITIRAWMKEIMKATILRDYSAPVVSSCDIEVLPLDVAQTMNPRPRPPSPTMRSKIQKERYAGTNPNTLTEKDAAILMDFAPGSPLMSGDALWKAADGSPQKAGDRRSIVKSTKTSALSQLQSEPDTAPVAKEIPGLAPPASILTSTTDASTMNAEILAWANSNLPATCPLATDISNSFRSGKLITRLLENLTSKQSGISDSEFGRFDEKKGPNFDVEYLDTIFSVFDYMTPLVSTDEISMEDMITGDETRLRMLLERTKERYPVPTTIA
ncbi:uncharacterized protein JCM6883_002144 [Sporobolomyces salmoneus]|uniref:uncharacterized protein n=1 Tax=Sporobolomyces salmoneus TaxID=183962 RepID=UPI00317034D3